MFTIKIAKKIKDYDEVRRLLNEYFVIRNYDAALGDYKTELKNLAIKYGPPKGLLLLAHYHGIAAGCVALQSLKEDDVCEMKRMFVSEKFRANGIGNALVQELVKEANLLNYKVMRLDSHPSMHIAQSIYLKNGFYERSAYNNNPTKGIRFFERDLKQPS